MAGMKLSFRFRSGGARPVWRRFAEACCAETLLRSVAKRGPYHAAGLFRHSQAVVAQLLRYARALGLVRDTAFQQVAALGGRGAAELLHHRLLLLVGGRAARHLLAGRSRAGARRRRPLRAVRALAGSV